MASIDNESGPTHVKQSTVEPEYIEQSRKTKREFVTSLVRCSRV